MFYIIIKFFIEKSGIIDYFTSVRFRLNLKQWNFITIGENRDFCSLKTCSFRKYTDIGERKICSIMCQYLKSNMWKTTANQCEITKILVVIHWYLSRKCYWSFNDISYWNFQYSYYITEKRLKLQWIYVGWHLGEWVTDSQWNSIE